MIITDERKEHQREALRALIEADKLVPEYLFYATHGSQSTFLRWQGEGLTVHKKGPARFIRPSELDAFLAKQNEPQRTNETD